MSVLANFVAILRLASFSPVETAPDLTPSESGLALVSKIQAEFYLPTRKLYAETANGKDPAFNWSCGVWLTALTAAAKQDRRLVPVMTEYATALRQYWNDAGPVPGYDVLPAPKPVDRYYDDNAWMVLALVEAYEISRDRAFLQDAERAMMYVLSGMGDKLGGGIYWRESDRGTSKNTCSNGPAAAALLALYSQTEKPSDLKRAKAIYDWTYRTLRDPQDGLMWDNIRADGTIEKYKWSYNTALMIRSALDLYRFTKDQRYRTDAIEFCRASKQHWLVPNTGEIRCEGKFAHFLVEAWQMAAVRLPELKPDLNPAVSAVLSRLSRSTGWYASRWDAPEPATGRIQLIDQAAVARALLYRPR